MVLCSKAILEHVNVRSACYVLSEATLFNATLLVESVHGYITANMETFLESGMLDDMPTHLIEYLTAYIRRRQYEKSPVQRSHRLVETAMNNQSEWLALQDIPEPIVRSGITGLHKHSPKLSPSNPGRRGQTRPSATESPTNSPIIRALPSNRAPHSTEDDIFVLDGLGSSPPRPPVPIQVNDSPVDAAIAPPPRTAWKTGSRVPRYVHRDMSLRDHLF